jgi:hypothetical protein
LQLQIRFNLYRYFEGAVAALHVHDRVALGGARTLMRSRAARVFFAIYTLLLHVFLAGVLYSSTVRSAGGGEIESSVATE